MFVITKLLKQTTSIALMCMVSLSVIAAGDVSIGTINTGQLLAKFDSELEDVLKKEFDEDVTKLEADQRSFQEAYESFVRDQATMSQSELESKEQSLSQLQFTLQQDVSQFNERLALRRNQELEKFANEVNQAVEVIAKEKGYDLVLEQSVVAYSGSAVDLTSDVDKAIDK